MFIKIKGQGSRKNEIAICEIAHTGELTPRVSLIYAGEKENKLTKNEERSRFLLEQVIPPHKRGELEKIFGAAHDNVSTVKAQQAMFEKFAEEFEMIFSKEVAEPATQDRSNEPPAAPIYFYQTTRAINEYAAGEIMANRYKDQQLSKLDQIIIYAGEERQLCNIYCAPKDREVIIRSVQKTIMSLSKKAAYDLHDILKMPRNGNDGPGGMQ